MIRSTRYIDLYSILFVSCLSRLCRAIQPPPRSATAPTPYVASRDASAKSSRHHGTSVCAGFPPTVPSSSGFHRNGTPRNGRVKKNIPQKNWHFEDDFPVPQVGYVNSLEGTHPWNEANASENPMQNGMVTVVGSMMKFNFWGNLGLFSGDMLGSGVVVGPLREKWWQWCLESLL